MTDKDLREDLERLGLSQRLIDQIITVDPRGQTSARKEQLVQARLRLLDQLHQAQDRLYRLDVIIHNLKS